MLNLLQQVGRWIVRTAQIELIHETAEERVATNIRGLTTIAVMGVISIGLAGQGEIGWLAAILTGITSVLAVLPPGPTRLGALLLFGIASSIVAFNSDPLVALAGVILAFGFVAEDVYLLVHQGPPPNGGSAACKCATTSRPEPI